MKVIVPRFSFVLILLLLLFNSCEKQAKIKDGNQTPLTDELEIKFDCYSGSQLEINLCSLSEFEYYDSILTQRYERLQFIIDSNQSVQANYPNSFEYQETKQFKEELIKSQELWRHSLEHNSRVKGFKNKGGSMEPLTINLQMIVDTKERIKFIEGLIDDYD